MPDFVWNTVALEGNNFTLPEVKTLLDGVTVGGRRLEDQEQILALSEAFNLVVDLVRSGHFSLSKETSDRIHAMIARHEAIESGHFRGEGSVTGGGAVRLMRGGTVEGDPHGNDGRVLLADYRNLQAALSSLGDPAERALAYFSSASRSQFYFDGNKRTARLMMAGELMSHDLEAINIPYARQLQLNEALDEMFDTDDATRLMRFLISCAASS